MPDSKITALTSISTSTDPANDPLVIVDVSDTSMAATGTTKKVTLNQLLGASGTATLASATITGDLTVDTSTLKVDSANNRVGVGTASPSALCEISAASNARVLTVATGAAGTSNGAYYDLKGAATTAGSAWYRAIRALDESNNIRWTIGQYGDAEDTIAFYTGTSSTKRFQIASDGVATWSNVGGVAGTAMTLNSTGLGVGAVPSNYRLYVSAAFASGLNGAYIECGEFNKKSLIVNHTNASVAVNLFEVQKTGTAQFLVDSSGNVGIGVTPQSWGSNWKAIDLVGGGRVYTVSGTGTTGLCFNGYNNNTNWLYHFSTVASRFELQQSGNFAWFTAPSGTAGNAITFTQAMTLDASGRLLVAKTTSATGSTGCELQTGAGGNSASVFTADGAFASIMNRLTSDGIIVDLRRQTLSVGNISVTTTGATFNSTSDYRLKEAVQPLVGGLARVSALKPSIYKWKSNGSSGEGFLAHELAEVVPAAVSGEKDAVNEDGSIKAQSIDMSRVVPILVAAIQELTARVQTLETR